MKFFERVQELIVVTNPKLYFQGAPSQLALLSVMAQFHDFGVGTKEFWSKCVQLLENIIGPEDKKEKVWERLDDTMLILIITILSKHD